MEHLIHLAHPPRETSVTLPRSVNAALVSWNATAGAGRIELAATFADGTRSAWLPFAAWRDGERSSRGGSDGPFEIAVDVARSTVPFSAIDVRSNADLDALWVATPQSDPPRPVADPSLDAPLDLDVPAFSQYLATQPGNRGLCSPAAIAMLLAFWGVRLGVAAVAEGVYDIAYGGAGNWAFNVGFAGAHGFAAATAYLRDLHQVRDFIRAGIPLALSIAWKEFDLPFPPLPSSDGHLVVVRGFGADGSVLVNDPAHRRLRVPYPAEAFERVWLGHGGVAYLVAPRERTAELTALANG